MLDLGIFYQHMWHKGMGVHFYWQPRGDADLIFFMGGGGGVLVFSASLTKFPHPFHHYQIATP